MTQPDMNSGSTGADAEDFPQQLKNFAADLRRLRIERGNPTLREIERRAVAERALSASAVSEVLNAKRLPRQDFVMALVRTLLAHDHDGRERAVARDDPRLNTWRTRWQRLEHLRIEQQRSRTSPSTPGPYFSPIHNWPFPAESSQTQGDRDGTGTAPPAGLAAAMLLSALDRGERITLPSLVVYAQAIRAVAFSPDGDLLAVASHEVSLWDPVTRQQAGPPLSGHEGSASAVAFAPNGRLLATARTDGAIWLWDTETRRRLGAPLAAHEHAVTALAFSPDGALLASSDTSGVGVLWNTSTWEATRITARTNAMAFSPAGDSLAVAGPDGEVQLRHLSPEDVVVTLRGSSSGVRALAFSPDGRRLATGCDDHTVRLWDTSSWKPRSERLIDRDSEIRALAFSPDGHVFATSNANGDVQLWDRDVEHPLGLPLTVDSAAATIAFSPDGQLLATGSDDGRVQLLITKVSSPWLVVDKPEGFTVAIDVI
ncbi:WD40 repeat domain-containing protein [Streptomyces sp. NBC_00827]|uniref:WD40 repeat domain-containing protein n=1 Tax=Streptomyces sp. NBC_00827 TaxID=2903677 RepID=UPI003864FEC0|nr:WD40 repeat domain-containing protein [Streptomyces sp. NBC_00827]